MPKVENFGNQSPLLRDCPCLPTCPIINANKQYLRPESGPRRTRFRAIKPAQMAHRIRGNLSTAVHNSCDLSSQIIRSDALKRVMKLVEQVACHPAAVLIVGETGTGKEMIARSIHGHSLRCNKPMVDVNCAAIPEHLVESELFGYEKGAFSGADTQKPGYFEMADGGTLFLDEIGDLEPRVQVKLLRVLDGAPYYRLGGSKKVEVDVRVVAATNQNLEELVRSGRFRNDLYHRLAEFKLEIPPLRERPEDLLAIAEQVLHQHYPNSRFAQDAVTALLSYDWPGNVRELRNSLFRAIMLSRNAHVQITAADLKLSPALQPANGKPALSHDLDQVERQIVLDTLERCGRNQGKAAQALGISRRTLLRKLKAYRETAPEIAVGTLCPEQQRYYRKQTNNSIRLKVEDEWMEATIMQNSQDVSPGPTRKASMESSLAQCHPNFVPICSAGSSQK